MFFPSTISSTHESMLQDGERLNSLNSNLNKRREPELLNLQHSSHIKKHFENTRVSRVALQNPIDYQEENLGQGRKVGLYISSFLPHRNNRPKKKKEKEKEKEKRKRERKNE